MLFLLFELGTDRYVLDVRHVAEVLPLVALKQIPRAPAGVAGVMNYRGVPLPIIDLSAMVLEQPAQQRLSTRIFVVNYSDCNDTSRLLGLIAEKANGTIRREAGDFSESGVSNAAAPFLGPVTMDNGRLVQRIEVAQLLTARLREILFAAPIGEEV